MANIIFENFCKLGKTNWTLDVIVEIVSRNIEGVNRYSVVIRKHEDEDFVFGEFPVKKGLIDGFNYHKHTWSVILNQNFLEKTSMQDVYGRYTYKRYEVNSFKINFFSQSSQQKFLSEIRRIQKM